MPPWASGSFATGGRLYEPVWAAFRSGQNFGLPRSRSKRFQKPVRGPEDAVGGCAVFFLCVPRLRGSGCLQTFRTSQLNGETTS